MNITVLPVSAIIPTRDRAAVLNRTLKSLFGQSHQPSEIIIIDASPGRETEQMLKEIRPAAGVQLIYRVAVEKGAAVQRKEGILLSTSPYIFFMDDDIIFKIDCVKRIWDGFASADNVGAVNAMITNQRYTPPGLVSRTMFRLMTGEKKASYAGLVIGPAWNLLPEDRDDLPPYVQCEWLNTTCTIYRREFMPDPMFPDHFKGYSMLEDVTLSLMIGRDHRLLNARTARIFHDSQPGDHKMDITALSEMELVNRHYVMTNVLSRSAFTDYIKLTSFEVFGVLSSLRTIRGLLDFPRWLLGKAKGVGKILLS